LARGNDNPYINISLFSLLGASAALGSRGYTRATSDRESTRARSSAGDQADHVALWNPAAHL
jgi:hypothetical protein